MLITIKPRDGLTVPHPETGYFISGEIKIAKSPAVRRLLKDGDIFEVKELTKKATTAKATIKKEAK